mgnify:CR=1 FL=1
MRTPRTRESNRRMRLKCDWGMTEDNYTRQLETQGGGCAICGKKPHPGIKNFPIDHCHKKNQLRGILCLHCNSRLGWFERRKDTILTYLTEATWTG